ncbi:hypothetical protein EN816_06080 [Mesorhizobium sp. M8A.F.Ca.ET.173.01.1.1]|nr:hypothetical protein EN816_06080 [Mesorhizobium sp. M8A.F.Ca.ET.173.01.1.1]
MQRGWPTSSHVGPCLPCQVAFSDAVPPAVPSALAQKIQGSRPAQRSPQPASVVSASQLRAGELCPEAIYLLQDCTGRGKLFALPRLVVPVRQIGIARLMVAMERVRFSHVKMLVALTPRSLLAKDVGPRKEIAGLCEDRSLRNFTGSRRAAFRTAAGGFGGVGNWSMHPPRALARMSAFGMRLG